VGIASPTGWYRDPGHADDLRLSDGIGGTPQCVPPHRTLGTPCPCTPWHRRRWVLTGAALAVLTMLTMGGAGCSVAEDRPSESSHRDTTVPTRTGPTRAADPTPETDPAASPTETPSEAPSAAAPATSTPPASAGTRPNNSTGTSRPGPGTALGVLAGLPVKGRAAQTGYDRDEFGQAWLDTNRNGCDTRSDILARDLTRLEVTPGTNGCRVESGRLADPYTGTLIRYVRGNDTVDIDHVVALSNAWQTGAFGWDISKRAAFANDPMNLLAVDSGVNRQKGDGDTATWLPPNKPYRCDYAARQVSVKAKYQLWVTRSERDAMTRVLTGCPDEPAATGGAPTTAPVGVNRPHRSTPDPKPAGSAGAGGRGSVYYQNCDAVRAAGADPIHAGDPGYAAHLDRDRDGTGCE